MKIKVNLNGIISFELHGETTVNQNEYYQQHYLNNDSCIGKVEVVRSIPTVNTPDSVNDFNFIIDVKFEMNKLQKALELVYNK